MGFVTPRDAGYLRAKRVRLGQESIDPAMAGFVERFAARFGVVPMDVQTDVVTTAAPLLRLSVVIDRTADAGPLRADRFDSDSPTLRDVQAIFAEEVDDATQRRLFGVDPLPRLFTVIDDFESVYLEELHTGVPLDDVQRWARTLGLGRRLWDVSRLFRAPVVFVHTDAQAAELRESGEPATWVESYLDLVRPRDVFDYVDPAGTMIGVDSRETFERDFSGNWYYYWK